MAAVLIMLTAIMAISATPAEDAKARIARWDQGPATIDVTNYPVALRERYEVYAVKCARCHKLGRSINADYVLPDQWESCVERMRGKFAFFFFGISQAAARQIQDFLVYDSSVRKKPLLEAALAKLSDEERKAAEDRIKEIQVRLK